MLAGIGGLILSTVLHFAGKRTSLMSVQEHALMFLGATVSLRHLAPRVAPALATVPFLLAARPATSARIATRVTYLQSVRTPTATVTTNALTVRIAMPMASA